MFIFLNAQVVDKSQFSNKWSSILLKKTILSFYEKIYYDKNDYVKKTVDKCMLMNSSTAKCLAFY